MVAQTAQPVGSYGDFLSWVFTHTRVEDWLFCEDRTQPLPDAVRLGAAMFWVNEDEVVRDLRRTWNRALGHTAPPPPYRRRAVYSGWR